jgi:protein TonB
MIRFVTSLNDHARRVVEEPKRSVLPYIAVALIAAVAVWPLLQPATDDLTAPLTRTATIEKNMERSVSHGAKGDLRNLFSADDYPAAAQQKGEEGTVQAALAVDAGGRVTTCTILRSSGSASLDSATCGLLQRRARFIPARDASGTAVPDRVTTPPIVWRLEG